MLSIFEISHMKEILGSSLLYVFYPIMFLEQDNKTKIVPTFFLNFQKTYETKAVKVIVIISLHFKETIQTVLLIKVL